MALLWLAVGIMHLTEITYWCLSTNDSKISGILSSRCGLVSTIGASSLFTFILCGTTALVILLSTRKFGGLSSKIVGPDSIQVDENVENSGHQHKKHAMKVQTALYWLIFLFSTPLLIMVPLSLHDISENLGSGLSYYESHRIFDIVQMVVIILVSACAVFTWLWALLL
ncbi:hypothetical protein L218DRAFT_1004569 [Marasmius fiardii PR-910]|nr:hypothetical protein L218DRAFT_1004569 [Marasmius fiardii PR-910]